MKRFFLLLLSVMFFVLTGFAQPSAGEILEKNRSFVVKLLAGSGGVLYREGFGYYAKDIGCVLTPYNNIVGFEMVQFVDSNGDTLIATGVAGLDQTADLALLKVSEPKKEKPVLDFSGKMKPNEKVFVIGANQNNPDTVNIGQIINAYVTNDGITLYNTSVAMKPGIEGGLVFDEQMKLVGITKGIYKNNYYSCYVIPLFYAKNLLEIQKRKVIPLTDSLLYSIYNVAYWRGIYSAEKGVADYNEAIGHFKLALSQKPKDINAYFQIGLTFGLKNMLDSSIYYYQEAVKIDPKFVYGYVNLAVAYIMKDNYASAVKTLSEAVKLNPQSQQIQFYMGYSQMKNNQIPEAIKSFKKANELKPNNPDVLEELAEAYYLGKKYKDAVKTANQALKINPKASNALYVLAVTNIELGNREEAEKIYPVLDKLDKLKGNALQEKLNGK